MRLRPAMCLILAAALAAAGADDFSDGLLDRAAVINAAKDVTRRQYPNADDALVDDHIRVRYQADGTSVTVDDTFVKVLTEKGKRGNNKLSFHFTLPYGAVKVARLEVIKPDGKVVPVDVSKQSRVMVDRSQMGSNIYNPNRKVLRVGVPGLEIGDIVRYVSVRRIVKPRVPNTFSDYEVLEYTSPVKRLLYEVIGPKDLPLRSIALKAAVKGTVRHAREEKDGSIRYRWETRNVPRMYNEPSMPPLHRVVQRLLISTIPDWRDISKWYWKLSEPHYKSTPDMRAKVAELTRGAADRQKKIKAIFTFVSQKIRYMGITIEKEAPGYEPHDVSLTFESKYGVCRDKAALLVAMLREAGFRAYPVLIHQGFKKDEEVPQPYFNHAVSAVQNPNGTYLLMDSTDESTKDLLPAYLCDKSYLVARPEGETLLTSPIVPAEENLVKIETTARLNGKGDLTAESVLRFEGINDNAYRGYFSRIKPDQRRRFFEAVAKRVVAGAKLAALTIEPDNMLDTTQRLTVRLKLEAKDILVAGKDTAMLPVPRWGANVGMVNFILRGTGLKKRKYPLLTHYACGVRESLTLDLGGAVGKVISLPEYGPVNTKTLLWRREMSRKGDALTARGEFKLRAVEFDPTQYLELKGVLKDLEYHARKMPIFASAPAKAAARGPAPEGDIVVLESNVSYTLKDVHTWAETRAVKKKILTYAGKKRNSEIKISYNPVWETVTLDKAVVIGKDGKKKTISKKEINVMDAAWVGAAPRYPAGKTLVASLPGVDVGSVVEYSYTRKLKDRPFFAMREFFRGFDPMRRKRVTLTSAVDAPFRQIQSLPAAARTWASTNSATGGVTTWMVKDQPAVKRERTLPPWWAFNPHVIVSTGQWPSYAKEVRAALVKAATGQPQAAAE